MNLCEVLIVEDDKSTRESWMRDIREFNASETAPFKFHVTFATTKREALHALSRTRIDCAVIDLRLPDGEDESGTARPLGNDILQLLLDEVGVPAVVYSGYEGETSEAVRASNIRVLGKQKGGGAHILEGFAAQAELMAAMESTRSRIAKETARLFNQSIWSRWENRWSKEQDREGIAGIIARQTASHIADSLSEPATGHHPDEFYIVPPLHATRLDTGDLLRIGNQVYVVLTPRCNMANKPPSHLILAVCRASADWATWKQDLLAGSVKQKDKAERDLRAHSTQGHSISSHFLPPLEGEGGPWLVDFQEARTVKSRAIPRLLQRRFASVAPHFVPNLVQRYTAYLGRIGQPDISPEILLALCKS